MQVSVIVSDDDVVARDRVNHAVGRGQGKLARVARGALLHASADQRRGRHEQGHRLALHVRAHEGAVGVVVLQERDQRARHRHGLLGRDVHVVDLFGAYRQEALTVSCRDQLVAQRAVVVQPDVGLGNDEAVLFVGGQVADLVGHVRSYVDPARRQLFDLLGQLLVDERGVGRYGLAVLGLQVVTQDPPHQRLGAVLDRAQHAAVGVSMKPYSLMRP